MEDRDYIFRTNSAFGSLHIEEVDLITLEMEPFLSTESEGIKEVDQVTLEMEPFLDTEGIKEVDQVTLDLELSLGTEGIKEDDPVTLDLKSFLDTEGIEEVDQVTLERELFLDTEGMATTFPKSRDANMNTLSSDMYAMNAMPGSPNVKREGGRQTTAADRKPAVSNNMHYRDPPRRRDVTPPREKNAFRPPFDDYDDPTSPEGSYRADRIQNDLLDEICSDIGIKDATDLDIFDFDAQTDQYIIGQTRLPEDLECLDETISFSDFQPSKEFQASKDFQPSKYRDLGIKQEDCHKQIPSRPPYPEYDHGSSLQPLNQRPITDEQKCASQDVFNSISSHDCLASPTVSSTCPGSQGPRPASQGSAAGSPAIHHPLPPGANLGDDLKDIKQLKTELLQYNKGGSSKETSVPSPAMSCGSRGPPSVECLGRFGPPSVNNGRADVTSTTPGPTEEPSSCMLSSSPDRKYTTLKPSTPGTPSSRSLTASKLNFMKPNYGPSRPPNYHDDGGMSGNVGTGSHTPQSPSHNMDPVAKEKVMRFLDQSQPPATSNNDVPSDTGSASSSPPQHVAKKARIINSGNDLLAEMRNRYAFVKGADMYTPNQHPNIDGTFSKPAVQPPLGQCAQVAPPTTQSQGFQGQFSSTPKINFADTSCMNNNTSSCAQAPQFNSCSGSNNATFSGQQQQQQNRGSGYYDNSRGTPGMNSSAMAPNQQYNQSADYQRSMSDSSQHYMGNQAPQSNKYGSCPNLGQQGGPQNPPHPGIQHTRVPVAQTKMSLQGYQNAPNAYRQQAQYETPSTSPVPNASQGMYPNNAYQRSNMNQSFSAPSTPIKPERTGSTDSYPGSSQQWSEQGPSYPVGQGQQNMYNRGPQHMQNVPNPQMQQPNQMNPAMHGIAGQQPRVHYPGNQMSNEPNVNMQMRPQSPAIGPYNQQMGGAPTSDQNCRVMAPVGPDGLPTAPQTPTHSHQIPQGPIDMHTPVSQHRFMQSIIADRSSAFRSHPLFPLLRDLIIADMNFHTPSFPFQLIANLPQDFDRLLQNYLQRNPPMPTYQGTEAVEGVIMEALKYAHRALIEKIQGRKQKEGYKESDKPMTAIEDFCERFDRAVKNTMVKTEYEDVPPDPFMNSMGPPQHPPGPQQADRHSMGVHGGMMGPPSHLPPHQHQPHPHAMNGMHSQSYTDLTHMKVMSPGPGPGPGMYSGNPHMAVFLDRRASSLPSTPRKNGPGGSDGSLPRNGSDKNVSTGSGTGTGKSKVLPKESVAFMMEWLRAHQDNPYPNDDEKEMLIQKTKLTINQINYWFTNARRRILPKWALQRYMEQQEKQKQIDSQQFGGSQPASVAANH